MSGQSEVRVWDSIATALLRRVFFWYLLVAVLLTSGYLAYLHYEVRSNLMHQLQVYQETFDESLELHLWNLDTTALDAFAEGMLELPYVVGFSVTQAETGELISRAGLHLGSDLKARRRLNQRQEIAETRATSRLIAHRFDLHHVSDGESSVLGEAVIFSDSALIWEAVRMDYLLIILSALLKTLALWLIFLWFSRRYLQRPLHQLATATTRIDLGNLEPIRIDLRAHENDEVGVLSHGLNTMLAKLRAAHGELARQNAELDRTVAVRTRELAESQRQLATLIDNLPGIVYRADPTPEHKMSFISDGTYQLTGYPPQSLIGSEATCFNKLIPPAERKALFEPIAEAISSGASYQLIYPITHADGRECWLWEQGRAVYAEDGTTLALEGFITDITQQRRTEQALRKAKAEAESANQAKSRFLASVSHELRTPLNAIIGFSHLLQERNPRHEQREWAEAITSAGSGLKKLVEEVLEIARNDVSKQRLELQPVNTQSLLQEALMMVQREAEERSLQTHLERSDALPEWLMLDEMRVRQVLLNLLTNAVKFTPQGEITLRARYQSCSDSTERGELEIEVEDSGPGIPVAKREQVFLPFEQARTSDSMHIDGVGLGLAIARQLAQLMGGELRLEAAASGGCCFRLRLANVAKPSAEQIAERWGQEVITPVTPLAVEPEPLHPPSAARLQELREAVRLGLTSEIEAQAATLVQQEPACERFSQELLRLAHTFDRERLLAFLEQCALDPISVHEKH